MPNFNVKIGWNDGIKMLLGGGAVVGVFVPGVTKYSSALGRALIRMGYQRPDIGYQAHHIVPKNDTRAEKAQEILKEFDDGVGIDSAENGVWLPANSRVTNWFNDVFHSQTFSGNYIRWVVRELSQAGSLQEVLDTLQGIRDTLLSGDTPWNDSPGDGGGSGAGTAE
jgi:hypothetical protein